MKVVLLVALLSCAFAAWPADSVAECNDKTNDGTVVIAPKLTTWEIVDAVTSGDPIDKLDHLRLVWTLHASYAIEYFYGKGGYSVFPDNSSVADKMFRVQYGAVADCWGTITVDIWLGSLKAWGFVGQADELLHQWNLTGAIWMSAHRPVMTSDEQEILQNVTVTFPIQISVKTVYDITPTNLKVFGTGKVTGSIILFKEHDYPSKIVTIYYLLSVQYPYRFVGQAVAGVDHTSNGIAPQNNIEMWYYIGDSATSYCQGADNTLANWCYQVVHVDYLIPDECTRDNSLTFDGSYSLQLELGCRENLPTDWTCEMPTGQEWTKPYLTFTVTSNNICEKFLNYDGTSITGKLNVYAADKTLVNGLGSDWDALTPAQQTTFVPDNPVWFVIDLSVSSTFGFKMTKLKVLNISFWKDGYPEPAIYANDAWTAHGQELSPVLSCDNTDSAACKLTDLLPTAWWKFNLLHNSYLNLVGKYSMKLECVAFIEITYDWKETKTVMFTTAATSQIAPGAEIFWNTNFGPASVPSTGAAAGSITGTVVGVVVGAAALIAAVSAFVVFKMKNKKNFEKQVESTTA